MLHGLLILLTGFGPFLSVSDNPSGRIIHRLKSSIDQLCGEGKTTTSLVLKVTPGVIESSPIQDKEVILSLGVGSDSGTIRIERSSRNRYTDPETKKSTPIDPSRPEGEVSLGSFVPTSLEGHLYGFDVLLGNEDSAGEYVCNDTYYRAIRTGKRAYFIHIPHISSSEENNLVAALSEISCSLLENK